MTYLYYGIITVSLVVLELAYFRIADHFNIIDKPNLRSSHKHITIRGGGVIFLLGAWLYAAFFGLHYPWFMVGLSLITAVSFIDDVRSVPNTYRLIAQFLSMFLMFYDLGICTLNLWWMVAIALVICVGIINAYNFMDGINGITGGYSLAVLIPLMVLNSSLHYVEMSYLVVTTLSVLVFCFFNFRKKARCFAGDVGAVGIAFMLLFALGKLILATNDLSYILFLVIYGVDSILTLIHRIILKEHLGEAHREHAYQIMANELKMPHLVVSSIYMCLQLAISTGLLFLPINKWFYFSLVVVVLSAAYILFMMKYFTLHNSHSEI